MYSAKSLLLSQKNASRTSRPTPSATSAAPPPVHTRRQKRTQCSCAAPRRLRRHAPPHDSLFPPVPQAMTQHPPVTPLECTDPERIIPKPFGMNRSKKGGGRGCREVG